VLGEVAVPGDSGEDKSSETSLWGKACLMHTCLADIVNFLAESLRVSRLMIFLPPTMYWP
jgi:hypothetical protein